MLPVLVLNTTATSTTALVWSDVVGPVLWATGFLMESVADWQKYQFKTNPANKGRFIDSGVYLGGNVVMWAGVYYCGQGVCCGIFHTMMEQLYV